MIDLNMLRYLIDFKLDIMDSDTWDSGYYSIPYYEHLTNCTDIIKEWSDAVDELYVDWDNPTEYAYDMIDLISGCCRAIEDELIRLDENYKDIIKGIDVILDDYDFPSSSYDWKECNDRLDNYLKNLQLKKVRV